MRWRLLKLDLPYLLGELLIVILGVLIALAANGLYENRKDQKAELSYLARINEELSFGKDRIETLTERISSAKKAQTTFVELMQDNAYKNEILDSFLYSSLTGFTTATQIHDVTYRELVSTGNLNIINDAELRIMISAYYRQFDDWLTIVSAPGPLGKTPVKVLIEETGKFPEQFSLGDYDKNNDIPFNENEMENILRSLETDRSQILKDSRTQMALHGLAINLSPSLIQANDELRQKISNML